MNDYSSQDVGYVLVTLGTYLSLVTMGLAGAYLAWLAIPVRAPQEPPPRRVVPVVPPRRMAPQRAPYSPRHGRVPPRVAEETHVVPPRLRVLHPAVDPWMETANTEIR